MPSNLLPNCRPVHLQVGLEERPEADILAFVVLIEHASKEKYLKSAAIFDTAYCAPSVYPIIYCR